MLTIANALLHALVPAKSKPFHFHAGDTGRAYVCENPHCTSPGLDPVDARA